MATQNLFTYKDAIDHAVAFLGGDATANAQRDARAAVLGAYRNLSNARAWSYLYQQGRFASVAPQTSSTITFDFTGGLYERMLTIAAGTWPDWAAFGVVEIDNIAYDVAERKSSTVLTLTSASNPGADVAALTEYRISRDTYPLPTDFRAMDRLLNVSEEDWLTFAHPREWLEGRRVNQTIGKPRFFTITGDPNYVGAMAIRMYPPPDAVYQFDYVYQRSPKKLLVDNYSTGTVTTVADSATLTGSGTAWASKHVGACIRLYSDGLHVPTGLAGEYPYHVERTIMAVGSATSITVDEAVSETLTAVKYCISDQVDLDEVSMLSPFLRGIEKELAFSKRMKERDAIMAEYVRELRMGAAADSRTFAPRQAGPGRVDYLRAADMPAGADLE